jgi:hypothetical protein
VLLFRPSALLQSRIVTGAGQANSSASEVRSRSQEMAAVVVVAIGFCWRIWLAHATYFNTDEAWHYSVANQSSLLAAYRASLTLAHPPLLMVVLYFWKHLGTSDVMLRLPGVIAGSAFCWFFYKWLQYLFGAAAAWAGLILAAYLPPMIALSAELRQYSFMLMFCVGAAYLLERALKENSPKLMALSAATLWLGMLSHYSAFWFAAGLGVYAILRMVLQRPAASVVACWTGGQIIGVGLATLLYKTHIAKLGAVYPVADPLRRFGDFYLADWYFHNGRDHLLPFLYRGTFGVFRFIFGQTAVGQIAAVLFVVGVLVLFFAKSSGRSSAEQGISGILLITPFVVNWIAVVAGLYPYGRTRQCLYLAIFGIAGVSVALARIIQGRIVYAAALALIVITVCQFFGTLQGRDMMPLAEQRHEHMDQAIALVRSNVARDDVIFTDKATSFQLEHYLCGPNPAEVEALPGGWESSRCDGLRIVATGSNDGALTAENVFARWQAGNVGGVNQVWVVQAGWASGLGEALGSRFPEFSGLQVHSFGRFIEVFRLPR